MACNSLVPDMLSMASLQNWISWSLSLETDLLTSSKETAELMLILGNFEGPERERDWKLYTDKQQIKYNYFNQKSISTFFFFNAPWHFVQIIGATSIKL